MQFEWAERTAVKKNIAKPKQSTAWTKFEIQREKDTSLTCTDIQHIGKNMHFEYDAAAWFPFEQNAEEKQKTRSDAN